MEHYQRIDYARQKLLETVDKLMVAENYAEREKLRRQAAEYAIISQAL